MKRLLLFLFYYTISMAAQTYTQSTLVSFPPNVRKGPIHPLAPVIDASGNLYGVANSGGTHGGGVVFKVTAAGKLSLFYNFGATSIDASFPNSPLIRDASGNFYGESLHGGDFGFGTIFKITSAGKETVLYSFPTDGNGCTALVLDSAGNLYGVNANDFGSVFQLSPVAGYTTIYTFCSQANCIDGEQPISGLIIKADGNLYGTTGYGGDFNLGVVFELTPQGEYTVLHSFSGNPDGAAPFARLTQDSAGNLYGTTNLGGLGFGTVFTISANGDESVLYSLCSLPNCADGSYPSVAPLVIDATGNLFGIATEGGKTMFSYGTIFEVAPNGTATVLANAAGQPALGFGLAMDSAGNLYGTQFTGGPPHNGSVYKLTKH